MAEDRDDRHTETFRAIVQALDHPGTEVHLESNDDPPWPLHAASAAAIAALVNPETAVWTDLDWDSPPADWLQTVCGASLVTESCMAAIALVTQPFRMPPLFQFCSRQAERPEASTTLFLQVKGLSAPRGQTLVAPGTKRQIRIAPTGLPARFWSEWQNQHLMHPVGVDVFFTWGNALVAMPRNMRLAA
jgi:alpha-D-ribose 1-methylphosphonate 5-triphosphate synthase subunit PhnH